MKNSIVFLAFAGFLFLFAGGIAAQNAAGFVVLHHSQTGLTYTKKQTQVITTQAEYEELLANYSHEAPRQLDFSRGRVLLVDMGERWSGGFTIEVTGIVVMKTAVRVNVLLTKPGRTCLTEQSITNPYQFVYIPTRKEILVSESLTAFDCGS